MDEIGRRKHDALTTRTVALRFCLTALLVALALSVGATGCRQAKQRMIGSGSALPRTQLSREEFRQVLNRFEDFFVSSVKQGANELDMLMTDAKTQRLTLLWRTRCISSLHTVLEQDDPLIAFIDAWALSLRLTLYFGSGEGNQLFGPHQQVALSTAIRIETEIERIAQELLEASMFEQTQRDLRAFAQANPMRGAFSKTLTYASEVKKGTPGPVETVINLPLAPFRAIEGVDRTSVAIRDFSSTAERFSDIVEELPESARWQLLLLLYELEETQMAQSFLASLRQIAESSARLTETSEKLPGEIRAELSGLIEQVDAKQVTLQQTLKQTQVTSEALTELAAQVDSTAKTLSITSEDVSQAGMAWQATVESIGTTFKRPEANPSTEPPPKFELAELNATARAITETAGEIRKLNEELAANAGHLSTHTQSLATDITWKAVLLLAVAFILAMLYRLLTARFIASNRTGQR